MSLLSRTTGSVTHRGLVLATDEIRPPAGRIEFETWAEVWNPKTAAIERVLCAYALGDWPPRHLYHASVDATPEVQDLARAWRAAKQAEYQRLYEGILAEGRSAS